MTTTATLDDPFQIMPRDGTYVGRWGGYVAEALVRGTRYTFNTKEGIRTPAVECRIRISGGGATVEVEVAE